MQAQEIISAVIKTDPTAGEEMIWDALQQIEERVRGVLKKGSADVRRENYTMALPKEFKKVYTEYIMREAALWRDDWDCYNSHNAVFTNEFLRAVTVKRESRIKNEWRKWR